MGGEGIKGGFFHGFKVGGRGDCIPF